jgi:hypothetical protein
MMDNSSLPLTTLTHHYYSGRRGYEMVYFLARVSSPAPSTSSPSTSTTSIGTAREEYAVGFSFCSNWKA